MLLSSTPIPEDPFFQAVGEFSKQLKVVLAEYFILQEAEQDDLRPYINYYRQLQNYFVFILRYPTILLVPNHSEIEQTRRFIEQKDFLIKTVYIDLSKREHALLTGKFRENLEQLFDKHHDSKDQCP